MVYMRRRHTTTGYSPNYLVYAHALRLPPPIGQLAWTATTASATAPLSSPTLPLPDLSHCTEARSDKGSELIATVHDSIHAAQCRNFHQIAARLASKREGGRQLCEGDLAYRLTPTAGFKTKVQGPFLVWRFFVAARVCYPPAEYLHTWQLGFASRVMLSPSLVWINVEV
jgi:hypothetical protein